MPSQNPFDGRRIGPIDLDDYSLGDLGRFVRLGVVLLLIGVVIAAGLSSTYRIDSSSEGVVLRFGERRATVPPGLHFKLPWPVDIVYEVPVQRIQSLEFGFATQQPGRRTQYAPQDAELRAVAEMLTGDLNLGHVEWIVQYQIKDPLDYLFQIGSTEAIDASNLPSGVNYDVNVAVPDTIRDVSESVMRKLVGDVSIDYVLTIGREQLAAEAGQLIQEELDSFNAGIDIRAVKLQTTSPPTDAVQDAFQEVNRARQKKERVVNEALGERNSIIPAARGRRDEEVAKAEGYQNRVVLETNGEINAFLSQLAEYEKAPEITRQRLYLEAMEEVLAQAGQKIIIDDSVRSLVPLLDLNQPGTRSAPPDATKRP